MPVDKYKFKHILYNPAVSEELLCECYVKLNIRKAFLRVNFGVPIMRNAKQNDFFNDFYYF